MKKYRIEEKIGFFVPQVQCIVTKKIKWRVTNSVITITEWKDLNIRGDVRENWSSLAIFKTLEDAKDFIKKIEPKYHYI